MNEPYRKGRFVRCGVCDSPLRYYRQGGSPQPIVMLERPARPGARRIYYCDMCQERRRWIEPTWTPWMRRILWFVVGVFVLDHVLRNL